MIKELISKYKELSFEKRTIFNTKISILNNIIFAFGKFILAIFQGVFFFVSGVMNIFMMIAKLFCLKGLHNKRKSQYNFISGLFLILGGMQYSIYMGRLLYSDVEVMQYDMILGIMVACISFLELSLALIGCFKTAGKGLFLQNMKLINLSSAFIAIVTTEVALMSFANEADTRILDGIFGLIVGLIIILIGVYILLAPKVTLIDKEFNVYRATNHKYIINKDSLEITLYTSKFYAPIKYVAKRNNDLIDGNIIKGKSPIKSYNILILILVIILSEILIFPYAIGSLINHLRSKRFIDILDQKMLELNYIKIN